MNENLKYAIAGGLVCGLSSAMWFRIGVRCGIKLLAREVESQLPKTYRAWAESRRNWERNYIKM